MLAISVVDGRSRRLWAIVLVLTLFVPAPLLARDGCTECPSDCPMHLSPMPSVPTSATLGCHRLAGASAERADAGRPCEVGSACGHDRDGALALDVKAASRPRGPITAAVGPADELPWVAPGASDVPEVPTGPPERLPA
jgi:hypothetical protein